MKPEDSFLARIERFLRRGPIARTLELTMADRGDLGCAWGCLIILALWGLVGLAGIVLQAAQELLLIYVAIWGGVLLIIPAADILRYSWRRKVLRQRRQQAIRNAQLPRFAHRHDQRQIDSLLWKMTRYYLDARRREFGKQVQEIDRVESALSRDQSFFEKWRYDNIVDILEEPYNRDSLIEVYNRLHGLLRREYQEKSFSFLGQAILAKIASEALVAPRWFFLQIVTLILTFGQLDFRARVELPAEKLQSYLLDAERFRNFLQHYFFEIIAEAKAYEMDLAGIHQRYDVQVQKQIGRPPAQLVHKTPAQIPEKLEDHETRTRQERREREVRRVREANARKEVEELARRSEYEEAAAARQDEELRRLYLSGISPKLLFNQFRQGASAFEEDILIIAREQASHQDEEAEVLLSELRARPGFLRFWERYGHLVLRTHHQRIQRERREKQVQGEISKIVEVHRSEQACIRRGEFVGTDPEIGYLLALARQRVQGNIPEASFEELERYLPRELRSFLERGLSRKHGMEGAIRDCNAFRSGSLFYSGVVIAEGFEPEHDRDQLVCAFVERSTDWQQQYWKQSYEEYRGRRHLRQKEMADVFRAEPITSFEEFEHYVPSLERMFRNLDKRSQEV